MYTKRNALHTRKLRTVLLILTILSLVSMYACTRDKAPAGNEKVVSKLGLCSAQLMNQVSKNMHFQMADIKTWCDELALSEDVQETLRSFKVFTEGEKKVHQVNLINELTIKFSTINTIFDAEVVSMKNETVSSIGIKNLNKDILGKLTKIALKGKGVSNWTFLETDDKSRVFALSRSILDITSGEPLGFIVVAVDEKFMSGILKDADYGSDLFILDSNGVLISSNSTAMKIGSSYYDSSMIRELKEAKALKRQSFTLTSYGLRYLVSFAYLGDIDWYIVSSVPYSQLE